MKLAEIEKFASRLREHNPKWEYSELQVGLFEDIHKHVDGIHLANIIIKKYMNQKQVPTVDHVQAVIRTMEVLDRKEGSGCDKCRNGFISVFNGKLFHYKEGMFISDDWDPETLESIFMIPTMSIICDCSYKNKRMIKISSYLKWLDELSFKAADFFEISYVKLYMFYSQALEGSQTFDEFDPFRFWGVIPEQDIPLTIDEVQSPVLKNMLKSIESGGLGSNLREGVRVFREGLRKLPSNERKDIKKDEEEDDDGLL